jgi:hypothetical protein
MFLVVQRLQTTDQGAKQWQSQKKKKEENPNKPKEI